MPVTGSSAGLKPPPTAPSPGGETPVRRVTLRLGLLIILVLFTPVLLVLTIHVTEQNSRDALRSHAESILALYSSNLDGHLKKFAALPRLLAESNQVRSVLRTPDDRQSVLFANNYLERFANVTEALECYVMTPKGVTLSASNWAQPDSFVGHDFSFRPYFSQAMDGREGSYFALGTTSLQRGYYFSYPVIGPWGIEGIAVVKSGLEEIEKAWSDTTDRIIITDPNGVIFVSGVADWMFRTLLPLEEQTRKAVEDSRRYPGETLRPLPITPPVPLDEQTSLITIADGLPVSAGSSETTYLMLTRSMPEAGWTVHILADTSGIRGLIIKNLALVTLGIALLAALLYALLQRMDTYRARIAYEQATSRALLVQEEALRQARDTLELRVKERTDALSQANARLRNEAAERAKAEEQLAQVQDDLVQAGKLAAIGQLAAGITHEVNQPLAALRAYADNALVFLDRQRYQDVGKNLSHIQDMCRRIADISGHLKRFAHKTRGDITAVALAPVISTSLELVSAGGRSRHIKIDNRVTDPALQVRAEGVRLEQVFVNILRNAVDAMQDCPVQTLHIEARKIMLGDDPGVVVTIRDSGPGLPPDSIGRLFEPFYSTKGPDQGLGLGLSISYGILESFGGALTAENHPDGGAAFSLWLKLASPTSSLSGSTTETL